MALLDLALEYLKTVVPLSEEEIRGYLKNWKCIPYLYRGEIAGAAFMRGTEIHFIMKPSARVRAFRRSHARVFIGGLLAEHGILTTRTTHEDAPAQLFVERFGFKHTYSDAHFRYYALTELPFGRN